MLSKVPARQIYLGDYGWHVGRFHFSFADYEDPENTSFGDLITFNDFILQPGSGFETHSHQEIEIISYCVDGELVHEDSLGNKEIIKRGEMQYTCAGSGITHSERNYSWTDLFDLSKSGYARIPQGCHLIIIPLISINPIVSTRFCRSPPGNRLKM